jgi:hypothetical protein
MVSPAAQPGTSQQAVAEAALLLLERMGLSPADLAVVPKARPELPTFAEYVPVISAAVTAGTRRAYGSYWNRIVEHWGGRRLDEPTPSEIRQLMAHVKTHVVARRNARGGRSAAEHLVAALRCLYRHAQDDGLIAEADNPAQALRSLAIAAQLSIDGIRVELQHYSARTIELRPTVMDSGAPPGIWLRTDFADYLYYESQTSPFHQAHILLLLAARLLLNNGSGISFDPRLVPDLRPEMIRLILGDDTQIIETEDDAEHRLYQAVEHVHPRLPGSVARRMLRHLRPLHATLLDAVPEAARAQVPGRPGPRVQLHRAVVEIREAVLALRPYVDPQLAAASTAVRSTGPAGEEAAAAAEASVLAAAIRARAGSTTALAMGGLPGWQHTPGSDLHGEAAWLVQVARAFDGYSLVGESVSDPDPAQRRHEH